MSVTMVNKKLGIVMPVANEEESIDQFLDALLKNLDFLTSSVVYLIMDDYSKDRTRDIVLAWQSKDPRVRLVDFPESTGPVSCRLKGFKQALEDQCDYILEMDSGFSHPPEKIRSIVDSLEEGADVVLMSRFLGNAGIENFPLYRRFVSRGGSILANLWLGMKLSDATSGYQAFKKHVLQAMNLDRFISTGGIYSTEMKYYCKGYRIKELPFVYVGSTSNFKLKWVWVALRTLFELKDNRNNVLKLTPQNVSLDLNARN